MFPTLTCSYCVISYFCVAISCHSKLNLFTLFLFALLPKCSYCDYSFPTSPTFSTDPNNPTDPSYCTSSYLSQISFNQLSLTLLHHRLHPGPLGDSPLSPSLSCTSLSTLPSCIFLPIPVSCVSRTLTVTQIF